jgi:hypothetical protein
MLYYGVWLCSVRRERNKSTTWPIEAQGCMCYTYLYQLGDSPRKLMKWLGAWDFQFVPDPGQGRTRRKVPLTMLFLLLRRRSVKLCHSLERVAERDTKLPPYLPLLSCFCFFSYNHDASCSSVGPTSSWSLQFCFSIHFPFLLSISLSFSSTTGSKDVEWHSAKKTRCTRELSLSLSLSLESFAAAKTHQE